MTIGQITLIIIFLVAVSILAWVQIVFWRKYKDKPLKKVVNDLLLAIFWGFLIVVVAVVIMLLFPEPFNKLLT